MISRAIFGRTTDLPPPPGRRGAAVLRPHRESAHPWPATPPRSRFDARPAEALAYTRMHPEVVGDPATSDRHRATPASVAVGSLHTNKTPRGAGRGAKSKHQSRLKPDLPYVSQESERWSPRPLPATTGHGLHLIGPIDRTTWQQFAPRPAPRGSARRTCVTSAARPSPADGQGTSWKPPVCRGRTAWK